jgi:hypothetical protein
MEAHFRVRGQITNVVGDATNMLQLFGGVGQTYSINIHGMMEAHATKFLRGLVELVFELPLAVVLLSDYFTWYHNGSKVR